MGILKTGSGPIIVFRTNSDIEASVVKGLLKTHGIQVLLSSDIPHSVFPLAVNGLGEVRLSVRADQANEAKRLIVDCCDNVSTEAGKLRDQFLALEMALGYSFKDRGLLEHALTHRSRVHEDVSGGVADNESLEFLGDSVLGLVITDRLFREFPDYDEGQKSKLRALLVSSSALFLRGEKLGLGEHLILGRGEEKTGGRDKPSLIANTFEAVIAAIYLDGGLQAAESFIESQFREAFNEVHAGRVATGIVLDYKSTLQEWIQGHGRPLPEYRLIAEHGPDHQKSFEMELRVGEEVIARATGRSKKEAEQHVAEASLKIFQKVSST
jgi:ribonuclease-3